MSAFLLKELFAGYIRLRRPCRVRVFKEFAAECWLVGRRCPSVSSGPLRATERSWTLKRNKEW